MDQPKEYKGRITGEVKLRDKAEVFDLKKTFGFLPETLLVMKVPGTTKYYKLMAVFTPEAMEEESRRIRAVLPDFKPAEPAEPAEPKEEEKHE